MKFYYFCHSWPYTAIIYAKDEQDAIAKYKEEVSDTADCQPSLSSIPYTIKPETIVDQLTGKNGQQCRQANMAYVEAIENNQITAVVVVEETLV